MKTPISYYGGKQMMLRHILPLIPPHKIYTESFVGGGAVFWAKEPSPVEVLNDLNGNVVNFYKVCQTDYEALKAKIDITLHSRELYKWAMVLYSLPYLFDPVNRAWAFWVLCNQGFAAQVGSWGYAVHTDKCTAKVVTKKNAFNESVRKRIEHAQIECNNALQVIKSRDAVDAFHYVDPPYIDVCQGHYAGYTREHFVDLLEILTEVKGKFLLSTYDSDLLREYVAKNGWNQKSFDKPLTASMKVGARKVEVLTANYEI